MAFVLVFVLFGAAAFCDAGAAPAKGAVVTDVPALVDPSQRYLFMHGAWLETHGLDELNPEWGVYEFDKIVRALADKGFVVIGEVRSGNVDTLEYANKVAGQVRQLLDKGVPAQNIMVIGHSKGGLMTLLVSGVLQNDGVKFVVMAGCGKKGNMFRRMYERFLEQQAGQMRGHILSLYDADDEITGSCQEAFDRAPEVDGKEIVFHTGLGHGLFYSANPIWMDAAADWGNPGQSQEKAKQ